MSGLEVYAARLRVATDAKLGKVTPQWVLDLAGERGEGE